MIKMLMLADDITGALDTGVKFAVSGARTKVTTDRNHNFKEESEDTDVIVINTETRHLSPLEAYDIVFEIVKRAVSVGILHIYKKTDSALRGNIGSELCAMLDASEEKILPFLPAYPQMNRITVDGIHYIDDIPVHLSEFGKDPFEPVTSSYVPEVIRQQKQIYVKTLSTVGGNCFTYHDEIEKGIYVIDTAEQEDLLPIAENLYMQTGLKIMAGCAGFASILPTLLKMNGNVPTLPVFQKKFLVICGSVNQITKNQLDYAEAKGFWRGHLSPEQKVENNYFETESGKHYIEAMAEICKKNSLVIIDTGDSKEYQKAIQYAEKRGLTVEDVRVQLTKNFALLTKKLLEKESCMTLMVTGGDTLTGFLNEIKCNGLMPIGEMEPGTVLSKYALEGRELHIISKSGGFGDEKLIVNLADKIMTG